MYVSSVLFSRSFIFRTEATSHHWQLTLIRNLPLQMLERHRVVILSRESKMYPPSLWHAECTVGQGSRKLAFTLHKLREGSYWMLKENWAWASSGRLICFTSLNSGLKKDTWRPTSIAKLFIVPEVYASFFPVVFYETLPESIHRSMTFDVLILHNSVF